MSGSGFSLSIEVLQQFCFFETRNCSPRNTLNYPLPRPFLKNKYHHGKHNLPSLSSEIYSNARAKIKLLIYCRHSRRVLTKSACVAFSIFACSKCAPHTHTHIRTTDAYLLLVFNFVYFQSVWWSRIFPFSR